MTLCCSSQHLDAIRSELGHAVRLTEVKPPGIAPASGVVDRDEGSQEGGQGVSFASDIALIREEVRRIQAACCFKGNPRRQFVSISFQRVSFYWTILGVDKLTVRNR